jgi:hypothetical protein
MSRLTYWLVRDWDEYVDLVRPRLSGLTDLKAAVDVLVAVARENSLGVASGDGSLPTQAEPVELGPVVAREVALLRGSDKRLPTDLWDRALLMRSLAWTSWPAVLVTQD